MYVWSSTRFSSSKIWQKVCPVKLGEQDTHEGLRLPLARDDGNFQPFHYGGGGLESGCHLVETNCSFCMA